MPDLVRHVRDAGSAPPRICLPLSGIYGGGRYVWVFYWNRLPEMPDSSGISGEAGRLFFKSGSRTCLTRQARTGSRPWLRYVWVFYLAGHAGEARFIIKQ
jgi:hypothetical protein